MTRPAHSKIQVTGQIVKFSRLADRSALSLAALRRAAPVPVMMRTLAGLAAFAALVVALPSAAIGPGPAAVCLIPAAIVAAAPRSRWVTVVMTGCLFTWIAAAVVYGDPANVLRVGTLAALLYLLHVTAAFAAVLPLDCLVAPGVVGRWASRHVLVLAAGLAVGLGGLALAGLVPVTPTLIGPLIGAALAALVAGILARSPRRG